jgi:hypothetical protein
MNTQCLLAPALALAALTAAPAQALGRLADVTITDRDSGETLPIYSARGEYWVEGRPGARYAIHIRNQQPGRLLAVTAVDGINVVSGETAKFDQRGYVFDPWVAYDIAGWRKSDAQIAAFEFTSVPKSYAARTGRADNVGVIGVALFRERVPAVVYAPREVPPVVANAADAAGSLAKAEAQPRAERSTVASAALAAPAAPPAALGTGHGQRESSYVTRVDFEREQSQPNELLRIRYDSHANLVARGILRDVAPPHYRPQPFPDEPRLGYVPDP